MIPIQLTIEGLYSYQQRQTIDFAHLTEAGLFGIFGSVGSGKSSILEAISFALYGETERLNMRDKRAYNMMNLKSNSSYIQFDFINHENKIFRATRDFKRNSKKFDDVKPSSVTFYEKTNGQWIPLDHSNSEEIIGLSYANFKRTIIIPQGQFKEFLELGATDRTNMMKEIFSLQKFDLQHNVSALHLKNKSEIDQLEGQLRGFEEVNEEQILIQKESLITEHQKFETVRIQYTQADEKYQQLKNLKQDFELLTQKNESFRNLSVQKPEIDATEVRTELFEKVFRIFNPLITEKSKLQNEITSQQKNKHLESEKLKETESRFDLVKEQLSAIFPKFEALDQSKIQENDLSLILQMLQYSKEIEALRMRTKKGSEKVKEVEKVKIFIEQKIAELSQQNEVLKLQKLDSALLTEVGNWFLEHKNLAEALQKQLKKNSDQKIQIENIDKELTTFETDAENFKDEYLRRYDVLESNKKELSQKRNHLEVQQKLAHFASELHEGESCPLCGALEHPNIVVFHDVNTELNEIQKHIDQIENQQKELQKQTLDIEKILERKKFFEAQLKIEEDVLKNLQSHIENHKKNFIWVGFNAEDEAGFEQQRQQSFAKEKQIDEIAKTISEEQRNLEKERVNLEKFNKALEEFRLDEAKKEEQIKSNEKNLKILFWKDYREKTLAEIEEIYQKLAQSNLETEQNYQHLIQQEKELSPKLAEQKTIVSQLQKRIAELEKEVSDNESGIIKALNEENFNNVEEIQNILSQKINVQEVRSKIQKFRIEFETQKNGIAELENKLKDFSFDEEVFSAAENQFKTVENELKQANDLVVKINSEIERLEKEFKKKEHLLTELSRLQKRAENLRLMTNLFKGAGFVQYVSSIYLRQLCDHANVRFHRMTRNQLSLQLNENNDFEIIDYLNEGRSRSVKTLSGGQAFQVSLSLALALAESVQSNAKAEKNFFFIDEGFGTQDLESVNIVFETLMSLQKENRIVGIISHVEELKEKIPASLHITKDEERGSQIEII